MAPITERFVVQRADERGVALVGVLLLLMMMSALAAALGVSGHTETLVARNHQSAIQARAAAEAGLNHVAEVATTWIFENAFPDVNTAIDTLLADLTLLQPDITLGTRIAIAGATGAEYEAFLMDEDDPARGTAMTLLDDDLDPTNDEDGSTITDNNLSLVVRAVGYSLNNTSVVLEAVIAPFPLPAIVTNGDLEISGNPTIDGTGGSVHSNADLTISGGGATITGDATASGTFTCSTNPCSNVGDESGGGYSVLPIPTVRASDHRFKADFILTAGGTMTDQAGTVLCGASPCNNWEYNVGPPASWVISGNTATNGTYYVEGTARISGNPGSGATPVSITIIAEGSIEISGNPDLMPDYPELMFVTDGDLKINGNYAQPLAAQGQMLVHEQVMISGNPTIAGQLIVENVPSVDPLVTDNTISGNASITYNGGLGLGVFSVTGWREVR